jgi:hypothetical protein
VIGDGGGDQVESVFREAAKLAGCSTDEVRSFDDQDLLRAASMLERGRALLDAAEARVLGELDARGTTEAESGLTTAVWLAVEARLSRSTAKGRVKAARTMRSALDRLDDALTDGRVSFDHARALAEVCNPRIADRLAAIQGDVIDLANELPFEMWRREVTGIAQLLDEDGGHDPADDLARNQLHAVPTIDGVTHVSGKLVGEHAAIARHALDTVADELFRTFQAETEAGTVRDGEHTLPRSTLRALAFVELCRRGLATDTDSSVPPRAEVSLVVRADRPDRTVTADGEHLPTRVSKLFTCDADVTVVSVDDAGVPLHLGRSSRLATPAQRRALRVRDGGCVFPGCDTAPGWCDAHHVIHWDDGGRTDLPNLCLLCRRHHSITHRNGWSMHAHPDGDLTWTTPTGRTLHAQRHQRRRRPPADADAA